MALAFLDDVFKSTFNFYNETSMSAVLYERVSKHSICTDELTYILWVLNPKDHDIPKPENNMPSKIAHVKWLMGCEEGKDVGTPRAVRERGLQMDG